MPSLHPIEIIGGGLAGLALGNALRRAGVDATVIEAGAYPRYRVCGEFIAGLSETTIQRLGLQSCFAGALSHRTVAWFNGDDEKPIRQRLPADAIGISRYTLDARLAEAFEGMGGRLLRNRREANLRPEPGRVIACGRRRARSDWIGLKAHFRGLALGADLEIHLGRNAYLGLAAVDNGAINACGLFHRRGIRDSGVSLLLDYMRSAGMKDAAERLSAAEPVAGSFCAVAGIAFDSSVQRTGGIRIGDACAMIPPFTGNGMAMAFQSAEAALAPLLAYAEGRQTWPDTEAAVTAALRRRFRLRLGSAGALHPFLLTAGRQVWLARLHRARVLPMRLLYAMVH